MFPPTVPSKSSISSATPYSVIDVPRIGIVFVAAAADCREAVAFARIKSTFSEAKFVQI